MATDAFGRLRTSDIFTTFNYYPSAISSSSGSNLDEDIFRTITSGTTTVAYNTKGYMQMNCNAGATSAVTRSTKVPMVYQPGKSRLLYLTGVPLTYTSLTGTTVTSRIGIFNVDSSTPPSPTMGMYFQTDGTNLQWVQVTQNNSGTVTTTTINQSSWNIDTFTSGGLNPSGQTLTSSNLTSTFLFVIDQEWLGVGRVRVGFILNGIIYYAHQFVPSSLAVPYTTTPCISVTYQITATTTANDVELRQICSTCISEGGFFPNGKRIAIDNGLAGTSLTTNGTQYIVLALRLNSAYTTGTIYPIGFNFGLPAGNSTQWAKFTVQVHSSVGPVGAVSLGTALTYTQSKDAMSEYAVGNGSNQTVTTDGYILNSQFVVQNSVTENIQSDWQVVLIRNILSQYDTLYVTATANTNTIKVLSSVEFIELP